VTFRQAKPSMRQIKRAAEEEVANRFQVLDHLTLMLQRECGRVELPVDMVVDRAGIDIQVNEKRGTVVFQLKGWQGRRLTIPQRIAKWLLDL
jgi:hypothetical protein